jgi:hypothetical protein
MEQLSFGALRRLRGDATHTKLARRACGRDADAAAIKSLANVFSRVEKGLVPRVSMSILHRLAVGLGYEFMGDFFTDWDRASHGQPLLHTSAGRTDRSDDSISTDRRKSGRTVPARERSQHIAERAALHGAPHDQIASTLSAKIEALTVAVCQLTARLDREAKGRRRRT